MKSSLLHAVNGIVPQSNYERAYTTRLMDGRQRVKLFKLARVEVALLASSHRDLKTHVARLGFRDVITEAVFAKQGALSYASLVVSALPPLIEGYQGKKFVRFEWVHNGKTVDQTKDYLDAVHNPPRPFGKSALFGVHRDGSRIKLLPL